MMSKNSFWANVRENNKRRIWLWIVSALFWFFYYPVGMALIMSRKKNHNLIDQFTGDMAKNRLVEAANAWLAPEGFVSVFVCLIAVVCAIQGFSYLYSRKKVDLYHSVPVKKSRRFVVIYMNGVLIFMVPYLVNLLLAMAVAGVNGGMNAGNAALAVSAAALNVLLYLGVYGLTIVAVMLTGNLLITLCATGVFLLYEVVIRSLFFWCESNFFDYFSYHSEKITPALSPMGQYAEVLGKRQRLSFGFGASLQECMPALLLMIFMAAAFSAVAYFCYKKRPAEAAGKPMAFAILKPVVKLLIVIPAAVWAGVQIWHIVGEENSIAFVIFGMAAAVIIGCGIFEVIYEMDIKAALRKKSQMLVAGAGAAIIYCIFSLDLFGYDAWIPDGDKLESAIIMIGDDAYSRNYLGENLKDLNTLDYMLEQEGITDTETVLEFSKKKADMDALGKEEQIFWCEAAYRMKNGKTVWRNFPISSEETEVLNRLMGSKEYKQMICQLYDDTFYHNLKEHLTEVTFDSGYGVYDLPTEELDMLRKLYLKDLEKADYETYRDEWMNGVLQITAKVEAGQPERTDYTYRNSYNVTSSYSIYPSYTNTIGYLKEKGIYENIGLKAEDIQSITVNNYHNEMREEGYDKEAYMGEKAAVDYMTEDFTVSKTFSEEKQIADLLDAIYSSDFSQRWKGNGQIDSNYFVTIQYKDADRYNGESKSAYLIADKIPDWLEKETAYK